MYDQRIGSAISDDLHHWTRVGDQPVAHPDPRWYKTLALVPPPEPHSGPAGRTERDLAGPAGVPRPRRERLAPGAGSVRRAAGEQRDGSWVIFGFRNLEPKGIDAFEILDPIPVGLDAEGYLVKLET